MRWANEGPMSKMTWVQHRQTKMKALVQRWANVCKFAGLLVQMVLRYISILEPYSLIDQRNCMHGCSLVGIVLLGDDH